MPPSIFILRKMYYIDWMFRRFESNTIDEKCSGPQSRIPTLPKPLKNPGDKVRPFRLVRYFGYSSLIVIFIGSFVLSAINIQWAREMQLRKNEDYARLLVESLNHQVLMQFILPMMVKYGRVQLRDEEQAVLMDKVVRNSLHSFNVETVNIYNLKNIISYSYDKDLVGRMNFGGSDYEKALGGELSSKLVRVGNSWEIFVGIPKRTRLVTFAPFRAGKPPAGATGPVLGVVEIVQDLTEDYKSVFKYQMAVITSSLIVMLLLFLFLLVVVNRGEIIIEARAMERLRLREELNRARHLSSLGEMTAAISHEIRNPLGIIRSSAALLKKKVAALDPDNTFADVIVEETGRLNAIITDFLNFARPQTPDLKPCRIEQVLEKNLTFLKPQIKGKGFRVSLDIAGGLPEVLADADMLYQAFLNILINAMQAMPDGGEVRIQLRRRKDELNIVFEDDGEGVSPERLEHIWDPFFTTKDQGTGLGLGIIKTIIEAHGGRVNIENRPQRGARLMAVLPIKKGKTDG
jgi:two-component system, NtrC family, sensor histidine kinase HydH